jgi:hypothetical protein
MTAWQNKQHRKTKNSKEILLVRVFVFGWIYRNQFSSADWASHLTFLFPSIQDLQESVDPTVLKIGGPVLQTFP